MPCWLRLLKYGCVARLAYKLTPIIALASQFSQELSAYTRVYTVINYGTIYTMPERLRSVYTHSTIYTHTYFKQIPTIFHVQSRTNSQNGLTHLKALQLCFNYNISENDDNLCPVRLYLGWNKRQRECTRCQCEGGGSSQGTMHLSPTHWQTCTQ